MSKTTKRLMITISIILILVVIAGGIWIRHMMGQPLYKPGMVRAGNDLRAPLTPPQQADDTDVWLVEEDIELYHFSRGTGAPVLFIHGGPGFCVTKVPRGLERLSDEYAVHCYDQRGSGRSTKPFDRFSSRNFYRNMMELNRTLGLAAQIADIERIRRILGRDKLILIGHSFGAFLAALYAAEFPERVEAIVLAAPADLVAFPAAKGGIFEVVRRRLPGDMKGEFGRFLAEYLDFSTVFTKSEQQLAALNREFSRFYMAASGEDPKAAVAELEGVSNGGWMVTAIYFGLGKRHDYRDALRAIHAPVLIVHGDRDLQPLAVSQQYAELLPDATLRVLEGAGHFMLEDQPTEFAELVRAFLEHIKAG